MFYPVKVKKLTERRRREMFWIKMKIVRRDDAKDKSYCGTTWF